MADKFLNETGLAYYHNRAKTEFANKIETVKVNGNALTPDANKAVDVQAVQLEMNTEDQGYHEYTYTQGRYGISFQNQNGDGIAVKGIDEDPVRLASLSYVQANGGKIDTIKVNGTAQIIANKEVDIAVAELEITNRQDNKNVTLYKDGDQLEVKLTDNGLNISSSDDYTELFNKELVDKTYVDGTFKTEAQIQGLIDASLADITGFDFRVVTQLPAEGTKGIIYLIANSGGSYDEYIWISTEEGGLLTYKYEKIGSTEVDLSDYWNNTNLTAITTAEIDTLFA